MRITRLPARRARRPMLLALVMGVALVLVGVTGSALVAVTADHVSSATLSSVVSRDASLVELFVNGTLRSSDLDAEGPGPDRATELHQLLGNLGAEDGILRIEIRDRSGRVIASDARQVMGQVVPPSAPMARAFAEGRASADLVAQGSPSQAAGDGLQRYNLVEELLPIVDADGDALAVVAMWRDADALLASLDGARRDVMLVTLAAGVLLAAMLFFVFRARRRGSAGSTPSCWTRRAATR